MKKTSLFESNTSFQLESGEQLESLQVSFTTYGTFNPAKNNVVWICHALTANSEADQWWPNIVGENGYFNPKDHFIVCANVIGSNYGSTGPLIPLRNKRPLLDEFPFITIRDIVNAHEELRQFLGINKIHTIVGASLGGQQVLEWNILNPSLFENTIVIASNARHSAYGIAFNESQRLAIYNDPTYGNGNINGGRQGLVIARSIAMLSYRSYDGYGLGQTNPGNYRTFDFLASSYQLYQGQKLADRFNAYSYITLSRAMDSHNVGRNRPSIDDALSQITAKSLIIGIETDLLFPVSEQRYLADTIGNSSFHVINSEFGHDGFLIEHKQLAETFDNFYAGNIKSHKPTILKLKYN